MLVSSMLVTAIPTGTLASETGLSEQEGEAGSEEGGSGSEEGGSGSEEGGSESEEGGSGSQEGENGSGEGGSGSESEESGVKARSSIEYVSLSWSINNGQQLTWNGKNQVPTASADGITLEYEIKKDGIIVDAAKEPGSYTVTAVAKGDIGNKALQNTEITFTITKAKISFEWGNLEAEYTGSEITAPKAVFASAENSSVKIDAKVTCVDQSKLVDGKIINAGEYNLKAELTPDQALYYEV